MQPNPIESKVPSEPKQDRLEHEWPEIEYFVYHEREDEFGKV